MFCSCNTRQTSGTSKTEGGKDGSVAAAASSSPGSDAKAQENDNSPALFPVRVDGKYGYMDKKGKLTIKPQFSGASRFSEGLAAVQMQKAGRVGYIDETGNMVIPIQFDLGDPFSEGLAAVMKDHQWGFMDRTGQIVIPAKFGAVGRFTEGKAVVVGMQGQTPGYTYINRKGDLIDPKVRFELAMPFSGGLAAVRNLGENIRYVDASWKTVIPPQFVSAEEFSDGMAAVQMHVAEGMRWGYVGKDGKMAIPAHYYEAIPFTEGLAGVKVPSGKWGFINKSDSMVITPKYDSVSPFSGGLAQVYTGEGLGYVDATGKYVWEPKK